MKCGLVQCKTVRNNGNEVIINAVSENRVKHKVKNKPAFIGRKNSFYSFRLKVV